MDGTVFAHGSRFQPQGEPPVTPAAPTWPNNGPAFALLVSLSVAAWCAAGPAHAQEGGISPGDVFSEAPASEREQESPAPEPDVAEEELREAEERAAQERRELLRTCITCSPGLFELAITIPLAAPVFGLSASPPDDDGDNQLLQFRPGLSVAFTAGLRLRVGPVTVFAEGAFASLGFHPVVQLGDREIELGEVGLNVGMGRGHLIWNIDTIDLGSGRRAPRLALWPYVGARVVGFGGRVRGASERLLLEGSTVFAEPLVGLQTLVDFRSGWSIELSGNVGGFTVGSDISTRVEFELEYRFTHWFRAYAGYLMLYFLKKYDDGPLIGDLELIMHGPELGLGVLLH